MFLFDPLNFEPATYSTYKFHFANSRSRYIVQFFNVIFLIFFMYHADIQFFSWFKRKIDGADWRVRWCSSHHCSAEVRSIIFLCLLRRNLIFLNFSSESRFLIFLILYNLDSKLSLLLLCIQICFLTSQFRYLSFSFYESSSL